MLATVHSGAWMQVSSEVRVSEVHANGNRVVDDATARTQPFPPPPGKMHVSQGAPARPSQAQETEDVEGEVIPEHKNPVESLAQTVKPGVKNIIGPELRNPMSPLVGGSDGDVADGRRSQTRLNERGGAARNKGHGAPCKSNDDCAAHICQNSACKARGLLGSCGFNNNKCKSGICGGLWCVQKNEGPCQDDLECSSWSCVEGICTAAPGPRRTPGAPLHTAHRPNCQGAKALLWSFDDGPGADTTELLLDTLDAHNTSVIFFVTGMAIKQRPNLFARMVKSGHLVGSHTFSHDRLSTHNASYIYASLSDVDAAVKDAVISGKLPARFRLHVFRAPYGSTSPQHTHSALEQLGYAIPGHVGWRQGDPTLAEFAKLKNDPGGKSFDIQKISKNLAAGKAGAVHLLHDTYRSNVQGVRDLLDAQSGPNGCAPFDVSIKHINKKWRAQLCYAYACRTHKPILTKLCANLDCNSFSAYTDADYNQVRGDGSMLTGLQFGS